METLRNIPKVLDRVEEIHTHPTQQQSFTEYKTHVNKFIRDMTSEVQIIFAKYQREIQKLKGQNQTLKQQINQSKPIESSSEPRWLESPIKKYPSMSYSPIKGLDFMQTAKSNMFSTIKLNEQEINTTKFSRSNSKNKKYEQQNQFPIELINPEGQSDQLGKSRFQIRSQQKKQRQQELIHFLQTGKKNLDHNTGEFMKIIGKNKKKDNEEEENDKERDQSSNSKTHKMQSLNKSLGNICNALDTSYISKKARSQNKKKVNHIEQEKKRKKEKEEEMQKLTKDRGLRSLLQRLRQNVENSPNRPPQTIKQSKLISCGKEKPQLMKRNSKVLINPIPVDIIKKNSNNRDGMSPPASPERKPQSILKQSSAILSRSLSGISAIDFAE